MSDVSGGPGWWQASDGKWYRPEQHPDYVPRPLPPPYLATAPPPVGVPPRAPAGSRVPPGSSNPAAPASGWWLASDGRAHPTQSKVPPPPPMQPVPIGPIASAQAANYQRAPEARWSQMPSENGYERYRDGSEERANAPSTVSTNRQARDEIALPKGSRGRRWLRRIWNPFAVAPRCTVSLLLVVASVVAGSYLLPSSEGLSTDAAIQQIQMIFGVQGQQAYLGVIGEDSHDGDIFIGTNTNQAPVHWELTFFVNPRDSLTIVSDPQQVGTGQGSWSVGSLSSRQSDAGAFWYTLDGTLTNTPTGYSELGKGYMQYVEDNDAAFKRVAVGTSPLLNPDQRNIVGIAFHIDGPVGFDNKSATQIRVNAPALDSFDSVFANGSPGYGAASLSSDMLHVSSGRWLHAR